MGATADTLELRLCLHVETARAYGSAASRMVWAIVSVGLRPEIFPIEVVPPGVNAGLCEHGWIELFRHTGCPLANSPLPRRLRSLFPEFFP